MSEQREIVVLSGVRTAIGDYGGSLKDIAPTELAARVVKEAVSRAKVDPADIGQCVFGSVLHSEPKDMYLARVACVNGGLPHATGALTVNRLCGSGLQAIVSAAQYILLGDTDAAVAGGAESMSRAAYMNLTQRWGARMGDTKLLDAMVGALHDPFDAIHMGVTAENVRREVQPLARAAGCVRRREPQARVGRHRRRSFQEPDPGDRAQEQEGHGPIRYRRACARGRDPRGHGQAQGGIRQGKRQRDRGKRIGHQRCGRGGRADGKVGGGEKGIEAHGAPRLLRSRPASTRGSWASGRCTRCRARSPGPASSWTRWTSSNRTRLFAAQALGVSKELGMNPAKVNPNGGAIALGASDRRDRLHSHREGDLRASAHRRALRAGHPVHRRRPGASRRSSSEHSDATSEPGGELRARSRRRQSRGRRRRRATCIRHSREGGNPCCDDQSQNGSPAFASDDERDVARNRPGSSGLEACRRGPATER